MSNAKSLAAIAEDVRAGECGIAAALALAYSMGYSAGKADRHDETTNRIVRVGEGFSPEVQSDAN